MHAALDPAALAIQKRMAAVGVACGFGAAIFWAGGLVAGRHGIAIGLSPSDLAFHRFVWVGLAFLPLIARDGLGTVGGLSWPRALLLTLFGGPTLALFSYAGFLSVPLGHGAVIQPSTAALSGLLLATFVLRERLPMTRALGAAAIVVGLCVIGAEALSTIGARGILGDLSFMAAGLTFAVFAAMLRLWRLTPMRAVGIVSVLSLAYVPVHWLVFGFDSMIAAGWRENLLQAVLQSGLVGGLSTYLFAQAVVLLGAGRAAVYPSLVPPFTLLIGFLTLGEVPSPWQLLGLAVVFVGFRLTQKA